MRKFKPLKTAEQVRLSRENASNWEALKRKYAPSDVEPATVPLPDLTRRLRPATAPSLDTGRGSAAATDVPVYTGSKMLGIGVLHKSNAVPVFSSDAAVDMARMRRN